MSSCGSSRRWCRLVLVVSITSFRLVCDRLTPPSKAQCSGGRCLVNLASAASAYFIAVDSTTVYWTVNPRPSPS